MKKHFMIIALASLFAACGAADDKNEYENYPTYDTTNTTNHLNDSTTNDMRSEGELRHNIDSDGDGQ